MRFIERYNVQMILLLSIVCSTVILNLSLNLQICCPQEGQKVLVFFAFCLLVLLC